LAAPAGGNPGIYTLDFSVIGCVAVGDFNGERKPDVVVIGGDLQFNSLALLMNWPFVKDVRKEEIDAAIEEAFGRLRLD